MTFFAKLDSTSPSLASNISVVLAFFLLSFEYVVAETISYHKYVLYFSIRCRDHAHISLAKWDLIIPFFRSRVITMGNVLVYR